MNEGHRNRLRERFAKTGFESFSDYEILEFLLHYCIPRKDTKPIAHKLIDSLGSLSRVIDADPITLSQIEGMGENSSLFITMIPQLFRKYKKDKQKSSLILNRTSVVEDYLKSSLSYASEEEFHLLCLDNSLKLIKDVKISSGTKNRTMVDISTMNRYITLYNATNIIIAHNHPNGEPFPSKSDDEATMEIIKVFSYFSVSIIDHIIVAGDLCFSYYREGLLTGFDQDKNSKLKQNLKDQGDGQAIYQSFFAQNGGFIYD